jgi:hypothetical protein
VVVPVVLLVPVVVPVVLLVLVLVLMVLFVSHVETPSRRLLAVVGVVGVDD